MITVDSKTPEKREQIPSKSEKEYPYVLDALEMERFFGSIFDPRCCLGIVRLGRDKYPHGSYPCHRDYAEKLQHFVDEIAENGRWDCVGSFGPIYVPQDVLDSVTPPTYSPHAFGVGISLNRASNPANRFPPTRATINYSTDEKYLFCESHEIVRIADRLGIGWGGRIKSTPIPHLFGIFRTE